MRFAVLTHFHSDHMGGAAVLAKAGAAVVAHENVRAWARREWQPGLDDAARARYAGLRLPDVTFRDRVSIDLGGRTVEVVPRPGHTGSDSIVTVPDARVLFGGDLVQRRAIPGLTFADTEAWVATLDELLRDYPDWTFVPGHGSVAQGPGRPRLFRDYLTGLRLAVSRALQEGQSGRGAARDGPRSSSPRRYGTWAGFDARRRATSPTSRRSSRARRRIRRRQLADRPPLVARKRSSIPVTVCPGATAISTSAGSRGSAVTTPSPFQISRNP